MGEPSKNPLALDVSLPALLKFALPSMAGMIFMGLYTIGDTVIVARLVNTDALSSINIATPIINIIVGLGTMLATGGSAIIAGKMGAGKLTEAWQDFSLITVSGAALGIAIAILGTLLMDRLIWSLGASQRLFPYCKAYLSHPSGLYSGQYPTGLVPKPDHYRRPPRPWDGFLSRSRGSQRFSGLSVHSFL